ncbi:hypothetical protein RchiOBHm_Chr5g0030411 [Rosa chinensis]|uniref:Uncharacterized protein n=1 Tax=Rosa chinensis TaxID=74649 RepID=A0A2P6Q9Z8_ROSCH|nr:hypothetical protein RchiOBHm_Chr5g0030411 [Rosa chinensis]
MWKHLRSLKKIITELNTNCALKIKSITDSENCQCRSVNFNGVSKIVQSSENYDLYMVGKLRMSSFQKFLQLVDIYFIEELMTVLVH